MGGSGQIGWSDATKFSSSSNITTTPAGQVTLSSVERLTNPNFTNDNSSWNTAAVPPAGWVEVPGNPTYETTNFLTMKYEPKCVMISNPTVGLISPTTATNGYADNSLRCTSANSRKIVSIASGYPIVNTSQISAAANCSNVMLNGIATHIFTNREWMTIARNLEAQGSNWYGGVVGTNFMFLGHTDRGPSGSIAASADDTAGYTGTDDSTTSCDGKYYVLSVGDDTISGRACVGQRRTLTLSNNAVIWDLSGNVWEWNSDTITGENQPDDSLGSGDKTSHFTQLTSYGTLSYNLIRPLGNTYTGTNGVGKIRHYSQSISQTVYAFARGGYHAGGGEAGVFSLDLTPTPSDMDPSRGFRCASDPVGISQSFSSSSGRSSGGGDSITIGSVADGKLYQSINVGDTAAYNLSAYVYNNTAGSVGGTVDATVATLYYGGNTISSATYSPVEVEAGWYKLSGTVTGVASSVDTGVLVKASRTVIADDVSVSGSYSASGTLTSSIFDSEFVSGAAWGALAYTATTPANTSVTLTARTSNSASMEGAPDFSTCASISSGSDISGNNCITDSHRYIQYHASLATSDPAVTPTLQDVSVEFSTSDSDAPAISITPLSPDPNSDNTPALTGTATDGVGTIATVEFQIDGIADAWTPCSADDGSFGSNSETFICTVVSALTDGSHTMNVRATDSNGNTTANGSVTTDTFTIDVTAPTTPGTPSATSPTSDTTPTWTWTASADATSGLAATPYAVEWSQSSSFASGVSSSTSTTNSFTHVTPPTDGTWYFRVKAIDVAGNDGSYSPNGSVQINTGAPTGTVTINAGAGYANTRSVTLTLTANSGFFSSTDDIQMKISNLADLSDASYEPFSSSKSWDTSIGDGTKTVYVQFKDNTSNESGAYTDTIVLDTVAPNSFDLQDPGSNAYTNSERPTFTWKPASPPDATAGLSKYKLEIDNGESGDFSIDDIPASSVSDYETNMYRIQYKNFSDTDPTNNYISVSTKSSLFWGTDHNDGKLKEGKISWKVIAYDNAGNTKDATRTVFLDRSGPSVVVNQINDKDFTSNAFSTSDKTPTILGKITDSLMDVSSSNSEQDRQNNMVASGPKSVEISFERKNDDGSYTLDMITTVALKETYWSKDGSKIADNSLQASNKYATFEYTSSEELAFGDYRITIKGKDNADNTGGESVVYLSVSAFREIASPSDIAKVEKMAEVLIEKELPKATTEQKERIAKEATSFIEITKAEEPKKIAFFEKAGENIAKTRSNVVRIVGNSLAYIGQVGQQGWKVLAEGVRKPSQIASRFGEWMSYTRISFGEIVFDTQPTRITEVHVEKLTATSAVITWKTNHLSTSKVNYGVSKDYGKDIQSNKKVHDHQVEIIGLQPGVTYHYEVMSQSKNYVYDANHEFRTPAVDDGTIIP